MTARKARVKIDSTKIEMTVYSVNLHSPECPLGAIKRRGGIVERWRG
jgi:hypothetical protein